MTNKGIYGNLAVQFGKVFIEGVLITMFDERLKLCREVAALLENNYGRSLRTFEARIPLSVRAAEAGAKRCSIFTYSENCKIADAYRNLTKEVLNDELSA